MTLDSIVILNLAAPNERFLGRLVALSTAGVTMRGVDLNAFEDWMMHVREAEEIGVRPATVFFPLHRLEKMILDEGAGAIPSLAETFLARVGSTMARHLE